MKAWLFDVDGVLTNPTEKRIVEEGILEKLTEIVESQDMLGLNTGRSLEFVEREVIDLLESRVSNKELLNNVYFVGEKGGTWARFENGEIKEYLDETISVPKELEDKIIKLINEKYSNTMFFDASKKTMISTEFKKGADLDRFHEQQKVLALEMKKILDEMGLGNLTIEPSIIATDIQNPHVGKDLGVQRFLEMLGVEPEEFETFGDSPGDLEMFKYLEQNGRKARFIYVGEREIEEGERIIKTEAKFDKGTLEYLTSD